MHRRLKRIVKARGSLDLQEAEALREAQHMEMWRPYGYSSLVHYMEMELGYSPRTAMERLRVANALPQLPQIAAAIEQGDLTFSGAKELTRVATPETETIWLGATKDMNMREVEQVVSGHRPGDVPTDPVDPKLQLHTLRFDVTGEVQALERQAKLAFRKIRGTWPSDSELLEAVFRAFIDGQGAATTEQGNMCAAPASIAPVSARLVSRTPASAAPSSRTHLTGEGAMSVQPELWTVAHCDGCACERGRVVSGSAGVVGKGAAADRSVKNGDADFALSSSGADALGAATLEKARRLVAPYQVCVTVCTDCKRGWQDGAGEVIEMSPPAVERALCDCQYVGDLGSSEVERAQQAIPPAVRRKVMRRDHGKCRIPGCRSTANLDVHHIVFRLHGGTNAVENLLLCCEAHHLAAHDGSLVIRSIHGEVQIVHEGRNAFTRATRAIDAGRVLRDRGIERDVVRQVIQQTRAHVGESDLSLEQWVAVADRYLARPTPTDDEVIGPVRVRGLRGPTTLGKPRSGAASIDDR